MKTRLLIAHGAENITLNKGNERMTIKKEELTFIVQSAINNGEVSVFVTSGK